MSRPKFRSNVTIVSRLQGAYDLETLKAEPMLFAYNGRAALNVCLDHGPVWEFLHAVATQWPMTALHEVIIDTRLHMLKPGWLPGIPGWHFDECPRGAAFVCPSCGHEETTGASGDFCRACGAGPYRMRNQPNIGAPTMGQPEHLLCLVDLGSGSLTQFVTDKIDTASFDEIGQDENVWQWCDRNINNDRRELGFHMRTVASGDVAAFGHGDFHRAVPATGDGWRLFMRATRYSQRPFFNEVRNQTQVYLPDPTRGW